MNDILGCEPTLHAWFLLDIVLNSVLVCLPCSIQIYFKGPVKADITLHNQLYQKV